MAAGGETRKTAKNTGASGEAENTGTSDAAKNTDTSGASTSGGGAAHHGSGSSGGAGGDNNENVEHDRGHRIIVLDNANVKRIRPIINGNHILGHIPQYGTNCYLSSALDTYTNLVYLLHDMFRVMDRRGGLRSYTGLALDFDLCKCKYIKKKI